MQKVQQRGIINCCKSKSLLLDTYCYSTETIPPAQSKKMEKQNSNRL
jgi:hypothetical protein